jgi:hypothetical protein
VSKYVKIAFFAACLLVLVHAGVSYFLGVDDVVTLHR